MINSIKYFICILIALNSCQQITPIEPSLSHENFSFKKGVVVTHWTGVVASRYLGQSNVPHTYGANWFDQEDIKWIASNGFDHIQINVDVRWWFSENEEENNKNINIYKKAVDWANKERLGVVLIFDVHPFVEQPDPFDKKVVSQRAGQWEKITNEFLEYKEGLRFHFGNREIPLRSNPSERFLEYYKAIRNIDKDRFIYVPVPIDIDSTRTYSPYMNYPKGATFQHLAALNLDQFDKKVGLSFTYFEPEVFIYQKPTQNPKVFFPGRVPEFSDGIPDSLFYPKYLPVAKNNSGKYIDNKSIIEDFRRISNVLKQNYPNRKIYLERFGIHFGLDSTSSVNYIRAIKQSAETNNISWCIYDYEGGRAIRDSLGNPFPHFYGLDLAQVNNDSLATDQNGPKQSSEIINLETGKKYKFKGMAIQQDGRYGYFASWNQKEIVKINFETKTQQVLETPYNGKFNGMGMVIKHGNLYAVMNEINDSQPEKAKSVLLIFDLNSNKMINCFELLGDSTGRNHFNHVIVNSNQVAYISNTLKSRIDFVDTKLPNNKIKPLIEDSKLEMIHGMTLSDNDKLIFFTSYSNGIQSYNIATKKITQIGNKLENQNDGLVYIDGNFYGVGHNMLKKYLLDKAEERIIKTDLVVEDHENFNDPRCLQIIDNTLYCLANIETKPVRFDKRNVQPQENTLNDSYVIKLKIK